MKDDNTISKVLNEYCGQLLNARHKHNDAYITYVIYLISTWLVKWGNFDDEDVFSEYYDKVLPLTNAFLLYFDKKEESLLDCVNRFMRMYDNGEIVINE